MKKETKKNEFHAYWQCPCCGIANMDVADDFLLNIREYECALCNKKYNLKKIQELELHDHIQVLCQPSL